MRDPLPDAAHRTPLSRRVRVIACGNDSAGDDAAGLVAVRIAAPRLAALPSVDVVEAGAALNAVHLFADVDAAVVVDAVRTSDGGRIPGELVRLDAREADVPADVGLSLSSHGFGIGEAIALAGALGHLPTVVVLGIETRDATEGAAPSPPVRASLDALADLIVTEAKRLSAP